MFHKQVALIVLATASFSAQSAPVEHIINGLFTDPSTTTQTGWTTTSPDYYFDGAYREFSTDTIGVLSQTITGAEGAAVLSFDFASRYGFQRVRWNGTVYSYLSGALPRNRYSYSVLATGHDLLQFEGFTNNPSGNSLANISLITNSVPEPESHAMLMAGLGLLGLLVQRKKRP